MSYECYFSFIHLYRKIEKNRNFETKIVIIEIEINWIPMTSLGAFATRHSSHSSPPQLSLSSYRKFSRITRISPITRTPNSVQCYNPFIFFNMSILVLCYIHINRTITRTLFRHVAARSTREFTVPMGLIFKALSK